PGLHGVGGGASVYGRFVAAAPRNVDAGAPPPGVRNQLRRRQWPLRPKSAALRTRVEEHRILSDLHLAVAESTCEVVHEQDRSRGRDLGIDEPEAPWYRALTEQPLAAPEHHGELPDPERIDQLMP